MSGPGDASDSQRRGFLPQLLRGLGISTDLRQRESILLTLALPDQWPPSRLASVIAAIVARSPQQQERLEEELKRRLTPAAPVELPTAPESPVPDPPPEPPHASELSERSLGRLGALRKAVAALPKTLFWVKIGSVALVALAVVKELFPYLIVVLRYPGPPVKYLASLANNLSWVALAAMAILLILYLIISVAAAFSRYRQAQRRVVRPPKTIRPGPTYFQTNRIAEHMAPPWIERPAMLGISRAVPFVQEGVDRRRLDSLATVAATAREGGLPTLVYHPRKLTAHVLVLDDLDSAARGWSDLPKQVFNTLLRTGIDTGLGSFRGVPDVIVLPNGSRTDLATLLRQNQRVLLVSDGAMLCESARAKKLLCRIGAARRAAWLDERERQFWHRFDSHLGIPGLPVWPGTAEGIQSALASLAELQSGITATETAQERWRPPTGSPLAARTAHLLGSAAMWAAACAMIQPIGLPLAQYLREKFFQHLQPITFGRLVALEGSRLTQSGLYFAPPVLRLLRQEFRLRTPQKLSNEILQAIRKALEKNDPGLTGTPLQDAYDWHRAKFLLDQDLESALPELLRLRQSELAPAIQTELRERVRLPHADAPDDAIVLLRNPIRITKLHQVMKEYDAPIAGQFINPWRLLKRTQITELPVPAVAVTLVRGVPVALLEDQSILYSDRSGRFPIDTGQLAGRHGLVQLAISHNRLLAAIVSQESRRVGVYNLGPADASPEGASPLPQIASWPLKDQVTGLTWAPDRPSLVIVTPVDVAIFDFTHPPEADAAIGPFAQYHDDSAKFAGVSFSRNSKTMLIGNDSKLLRFQPFENRRPGVRIAKEATIYLDCQEEETDLVRIEGVAAGDDDGWPSAVAGAGLVQVIRRHLPREDPRPAHGSRTRDGPWRVPPGRITAVDLVENGQTVAVLVDGRLAIRHGGTGVDLLVEDQPDQNHHAALAVSMRAAFLWGPERRSITRHGFDSEAGGSGNI